MARSTALTKFLDSLRYGIGKAATWVAQKSIGERRVAEMIGGFRYGGYPGTWTGDRIEQVRHYRHWVYRAIEAIGRQLAAQPPVAGKITSPGEAKQYRSRVKEFRRKARDPYGLATLPFPERRFVHPATKRKAVGSIRIDEEVEYVSTDHDLMRLLRDPNGPDTGGELIRELDLFLELTGNSYLWPVPNGAGRIVELWVIPAHWVYPVSTGTKRLVDYYELRPYEGIGQSPVSQPARWDASELIHFRFKSPLSKIDGHSPTQAGAEMIDVYESIQASRFFACKQGANVGAVIQLGPDTDVQGDEDMRRIEAKWFQRFQGEHGFMRPMILPPGASLIPAPPEREIAYITSSDQMRDYIAAMYGVPKTVMGFTDQVNRATFVGTLAAFLYLTVAPRAKLIYDVMTEKLAVPHYGEAMRIWTEDLTPSDPDADRADADMLANRGAVTPNELRAKYGYEPYEHGGDDPLVGMGIAPLVINTGDPDAFMVSAAEYARYEQTNAGGPAGEQSQDEGKQSALADDANLSIDNEPTE